MKRIVVLIALVFIARFSFGQKIESIYFNLYTDSLKKGFYNYINIDGKNSHGQWQPLDSNNIIFTSNAGYFKGNDLFIDSSYTGETVIVKACLKSDPSIWKQTIIYIRKRPFTEPLKTNEEVLSEMREKRKKK